MRIFLALFLALSFDSCTPVFAQEEIGGGVPLGDASSTTQIEPPPVPNAPANPAAILSSGAEDFTPSRSRSPWGAAFFNLSTLPIEGVDSGQARLSTYNFVSFDYRLNYQRKLSLRPEFYFTGAGVDDFSGRYESDEIRMGDIYLQLSDRSLALLEANVGDIGLSGAFRAYLPNSESSRRQQQVTQLQARMMFYLPLANDWHVNYHFRPKYWVQANRTYSTEFGNVRATKFAELEQSLEIMKTISRNFAVIQSIGPTHTWYYGSDENNIEPRTDSILEMSTMASVNVSGVLFKGGLSYDSMLGRPGRDPKIYNSKETSYILMTYLSF